MLLNEGLIISKGLFNMDYIIDNSIADDFISEAEKLFDSLFSFEDISIDEVLKVVSDAFIDLAWEIDHFSFETVERAFDTLRLKIKAFSDLLISNEGIATFVTNFKKYGEELKDAFTLENLLGRLEKVMDIFGKFFNLKR